jgi:hypothetical protein
VRRQAKRIRSRERHIDVDDPPRIFGDLLRVPGAAERIRRVGPTPAGGDLTTLCQRADEDIAEYGEVIAETGIGIGK